KSHAMTGWRIGYIACTHKDVLKAVGSLQSHSTSNPTSVAQWATVEALNGPQDAVAKMVAEFAKRRDYLVERLRALPGVQCPVPEGAFYVFSNISAAFGRTYKGRRIGNSLELCDALL